MKQLLFYMIILALTLNAPAQASTLSYQPSIEDKKFLTQIQRDSLTYFIQFTNERTGLVKDSSRPGSPASIASTGFGLLLWALAKENGWMSYQESYNLTLKCLRFLKNKADHKNGFFYHMLSTRSGKRVWSSEASSIDTALLVAGALYAGSVFKGTDVERLANEIYKRVDWKWMTNGTNLLCHGWKPESGFLPYYWDMYSEHLILQALAIGSPTHPIPQAAWNEWERLEGSYNKKQVIYSFSGSIFTYQFSHAYIDFRNLWDRDINYFDNSKNATLINREFCISNKEEIPSYSETVWGLSACLGPKGYKAYGAPPGKALHDGTIAVHSAAGSIPFAPEETIDTLKYFYNQYKDNIYTEYGFIDSFNLEMNWWSNEHLGIDQGISIMMIENFLRETIWKRFMTLDCVQRWIEICELNKKPTTRKVTTKTVGPRKKRIPIKARSKTPTSSSLKTKNSLTLEEPQLRIIAGE